MTVKRPPRLKRSRFEEVQGLRVPGEEVTEELARVRLAWDTVAQHSSWEGGPDGRAGMAQRGESSHLPGSRELASRWSRHGAVRSDERARRSPNSGPNPLVSFG